MLTTVFGEYCYILPFVLSSVFNWFFFIKNNFFVVRVKNQKTDKVTKGNVIKKLNFKLYILWNNITLSLLCLSIFVTFGFQQNFWWNHFKLSNFTLLITLFILFVNLFLNYFLGFLNKVNLNYNIDYVFTLGNLASAIVLIFFVNTLYTFLFILEVNSSLIFYKFVVSKFWFKNNKISFMSNFTKYNRVLPKFYVNTLFFQYWVTFFSSILTIYALANLILIYGSTEWVFLEFVSYSNFVNLYFNNWLFLTIIWFSFIFGFLLKIGFTPLHLFKIEVYKGLPFLSIFFYTTYYFVAFFLFFIVLFLNYFYSVASYWWYILLLITVLGGVYILFLFFDVNYLKAFFGYSTIINTYSLTCILLVGL